MLIVMPNKTLISDDGRKFRLVGQPTPAFGRHGDCWVDVGRLTSGERQSHLVLHQLGSLPRYRCYDTSGTVTITELELIK